MNKPVYLGLSILETNKTVMYEFWYLYVKPKHGEKLKLSCMNTNSFIVQLKTDFYVDIAKAVETKSKFQIMNEKDRYLQEKLKKQMD